MNLQKLKRKKENNMNPMQMLKMMFQAKRNPQELLSSIVGKNNNPMINNLMKMAKEGDKEGIENVARNLFKEKGMNFDQEFEKFMNSLK